MEEVQHSQCLPNVCYQNNFLYSENHFVTHKNLTLFLKQVMEANKLYLSDARSNSKHFGRESKF